MPSKIPSHAPWWSKKWGRDKICPILQGRMRPHGKRSIQTECGHRFFEDAFLAWIGQGNDTCPLCRAKILFE